MRLELPEGFAAAVEGPLSLEQGPLAGRDYRIRWEPCPDPTCACGELRATLVPAGGSGETTRWEEGIRLAIDVWERRVLEGREGKSSPEERELCEGVRREVTADQWQDLASFLVRMKLFQVNSMAVGQCEIRLPKQLLLDPNPRLGYGVVFPFGEMFTFSCLGAEWRARTSFCVRPGCSCTQVALEFLRARDAAGEESTPTCEVTFDYVQKRHEVRRESRLGDPPACELLSAYLGPNDEMSELLRVRHGQLRLLFINSLMRHLRSEPHRPRSRPQRNEPCPCGSGLKYKKCCGA